MKCINVSVVAIVVVQVGLEMQEKQQSDYGDEDGGGDEVYDEEQWYRDHQDETHHN